MHDFDKNRLPTSLNWLFQRTENGYDRFTRRSLARRLHTQRFNTSTYGLSSLRYTGTKALTSLKNGALLNNVTNKKHLKRLFSDQAFESY